jgi:ferric-dicitrate binding protein FerR (iron transport regulator)
VPEDPWAGFHLDPRRPEHARIRATDADRERARDLLGEAYADGRLDRDELDARTSRVAGPITLGALLHLLSDLEPVRGAPAGRTRRPAARELLGFVVCSAVCVMLWWLTGRGFFWPLWVLVFTGLPPLATLVAGRTVGGRGKGHTL